MHKKVSSESERQKHCCLEWICPTEPLYYISEMFNPLTSFIANCHAIWPIPIFHHERHLYIRENASCPKCSIDHYDRTYIYVCIISYSWFNYLIFFLHSKYQCFQPAIMEWLLHSCLQTSSGTILRRPSPQAMVALCATAVYILPLLESEK